MHCHTRAGAQGLYYNSYKENDPIDVEGTCMYHAVNLCLLLLLHCK